jgi:hypothetical protein
MSNVYSFQYTQFKLHQYNVLVCHKIGPVLNNFSRTSIKCAENRQRI